jgi:hypothetical protein
VKCQSPSVCDNSRDLQTILSSLNDFNRYGDLYLRVNLVHVPAVSFESIPIDAIVTADSTGKAAVKGKLYKPNSLKDLIDVRVQIFDSHDKLIHADENRLTPWFGEIELTKFEAKDVAFWPECEDCPAFQPQHTSVFLRRRKLHPFPLCL